MIFVTLMSILPDRTRRISPSRRKREKKPTSFRAKMAKSRQNQKKYSCIWDRFANFSKTKWSIFWWNTFNTTANHILNPLLPVFDGFYTDHFSPLLWSACHKKRYLLCVELTNFGIFTKPLPIFFQNKQNWDSHTGQRQLISDFRFLTSRFVK